jgi:hypothetical protein
MSLPCLISKKCSLARDDVCGKQGNPISIDPYGKWATVAGRLFHRNALRSNTTQQGETELSSPGASQFFAASAADPTTSFHANLAFIK